MTRKLLLAGLVVIGETVVGRLAYHLVIDRPGEYTDCLLDHRSGYHLPTPRDELRSQACRNNLNPFHL